MYNHLSPQTNFIYTFRLDFTPEFVPFAFGSLTVAAPLNQKVCYSSPSFQQ